jgi:hypothetical protein
VKDGHIEAVKRNKCGKGVQFADKKLNRKGIVKD